MSKGPAALLGVIEVLLNRYTRRGSVLAPDRQLIEQRDENLATSRHVRERRSGGRLGGGKRDPNEGLVGLRTDRRFTTYGDGRTVCSYPRITPMIGHASILSNSPLRGPLCSFDREGRPSSLA